MLACLQVGLGGLVGSGGVTLTEGMLGVAIEGADLSIPGEKPCLVLSGRDLDASGSVVATCQTAAIRPLGAV